MSFRLVTVLKTLLPWQRASLLLWYQRIDAAGVGTDKLKRHGCFFSANWIWEDWRWISFSIAANLRKVKREILIRVRGCPGAILWSIVQCAGVLWFTVGEWKWRQVGWLVASSKFQVQMERCYDLRWGLERVLLWIELTKGFRSPPVRWYASKQLQRGRSLSSLVLTQSSSSTDNLGSCELFKVSVEFLPYPCCILHI